MISLKVRFSTENYKMLDEYQSSNIGCFRFKCYFISIKWDCNLQEKKYNSRPPAIGELYLFWKDQCWRIPSDSSYSLYYIYHIAEKDLMLAWGGFCFFQEIDNAPNGAWKHLFWIHWVLWAFTVTNQLFLLWGKKKKKSLCAPSASLWKFL